MVTSNGSQIPVSVGAGCTPGTNEVSFECNFNDLFTWEGEGTEDGNVASMPDPPNDSVATWTILGPGWTTLTLSDPGAGYTGTFARAPVNVPNLTGQTWFSTEVVDVSNCGKSPYTRYNTYVISQPGMGGWLLWPYWPGFVATASDGIALSLTSTAASGVQVSGSYPLDGGIARVSGQLNLSPDGKTYSGTLNWSWKGAAGSCTGTTLFSASIFTAS